MGGLGGDKKKFIGNTCFQDGGKRPKIEIIFKTFPNPLC